MNLVMKLRAAVEECFEKAEAHYGEKIPRAEVKFDLKGRAAGQSCYSKRSLRFNLKLAVDNEQEFLEIVVPHEVSHHICRWKHGYEGVKSHGREFSNIMIGIFHLPPSRLHRMDVSKVARKTKQYKYVCGCPGKFLMIGAIRHKRILRGNVYGCKACGESIKFAEKLEKLPAPPNRFLREEILD